MIRINQHKNFLQRVKSISNKLTAGATCPLPPRNCIGGYRKAEKDFDHLPAQWQKKIENRINQAMNSYHEPKIKGRNGQWFSPYDMDMAMMYGYKG